MLLWQVLLGIFFLGAWQWGASAGLLDRLFFSEPSSVAARVWKLFLEGEIWTHLAVTVTEALLSFVLGVLLGIVFGLALARMPRLASLLDPYLRLANSLPRVVLACSGLGWESGPRWLSGLP
jgi:NitT/TauT family transport system permease protein